MLLRCKSCNQLHLCNFKIRLYIGGKCFLSSMYFLKLKFFKISEVSVSLKRVLFETKNSRPYHTSRPTWSFKNKPWHDWHWLDAENMIDWLSVSPRTCLFRVTIMFVSFITVRSIIFVFLVMASVFSTFPPTYPAEWSINSLLIITK